MERRAKGQEQGAWRWLSAIEFAIGAAIVIGHNVYHVVPNEVPILFVLGLLSVRLRDGRWSAIGFKRPNSWTLIFLIALVAAALRIVLGNFVIEPLAAHFWPPIKAPGGVEPIVGNLKLALLYLAIVWTFAAFGEEVSYRGYLTIRGGHRQTVRHCFLDRDDPGVSAVWLWSLL